MCEETSIGVSRAITTWGGTSRSFCLEGLPVEGRTIEKTLLLSAGCQRTPVGTTVCGILPTDVTEAVTARYGTSAGSGGKEGNQKAMKGKLWRRRGRRSVEANSRERVKRGRRNKVRKGLISSHNKNKVAYFPHTGPNLFSRTL